MLHNKGALPVPTTTAPIPEPTARLRGQMGTPLLTVLVLACLSPLTGAAGYIGLAIYAGNGIGVPFMYLLVGVTILIFAVGYVAMVRKIARPGGFYAYITAGLGKRIGLGGAFLTVVTYLLGQTGLIAFAGITLSGTIESMLNGPHIAWWVCTLPFLVVSAVLSYFNIALSAKFLGVILVVEIIIVLVFDLVVAVQGGHEGISPDSFTFSALTSGSTALAFLYGLSVYTGFESTALYYEEVRDPQKTIARATYVIVGVITAFYAFTAWMLITGYGSSNVIQDVSSDYSNAFGRSVAAYLGVAMSDVMNVVLLTGLLASLISGNNLLSRYVFSLGADRVAPAYFGHANAKHGSPARAGALVHGLLFVGLGAIVATETAANDVLALTASAGMYGFLMMFFLATVAILVYFLRHPQPTASQRVMLFVAPLISGVIFGCALVYVARNFDLIVGDKPILTLALQVIVYASFVGGVVYASYLASSRKEVFARIGRADFETEVAL